MSQTNKIYDFFENPKGLWAILTQIFIVILILASVVLVGAEFYYHEFYLQNKNLFINLNHFILAVFTVEYILRFSTSPKKGRFFVKPMNLIDFLAVFPNYLEFIVGLAFNTTELRVLRVIRFLRFARILRAFRLFRYGQFFKRIFSYQNTILQSITPIISLFFLIKIVIYILERKNWWIDPTSLNELFALIGFALGIILSQKIGSSYDKFITVEESIIKIYGALKTMRSILNKHKDGLGSTAVKKWAQAFLRILEDPKADNFSIHTANDELYAAIAELEPQPADLANWHIDICRDAAYVLSKKVRLTPKAYDILLNQATILYLFLLAVFIPGIAGIISVLVATYILYGMYNLTQDIDSIFGGEFNIINIDISELKYLTQN